MNKLEIEELKTYRSKSKRDSLFLKMLKNPDNELNMYKQHYGNFMSEDEVEANAVLSLDSAYEEVEERMFEFALQRINFKRIFSKHLQRTCRKLKEDNEPLSKSLGKGFRNENSRRCWDGYLANFSTTNEELLIDETFMKSFNNNSDYLTDIAKMTKSEEGSDVYLDLMSRYMDHMSYKEIALEPRNSGRGILTISKRLRNYVAKLQKRANLLKIEGL